MLVKIINTTLILFAVFMGLKQGYAMLSGKPEMIQVFEKWNFSRAGVMLNGTITIISSLMILHPKTFVAGNFLVACGILLIICLELVHKNLKAATVELPFFLLHLLIIYLQYPFTLIKTE